MDLYAIFNRWIRSESFGWRLASVLLLAILACGAGCNRKGAHPDQEAAPVPRFSLESFPRSNKMRLAILPCRVLPRTSMPINSPLAGQLRLYVDKAQTNLPANFLWAEFEPKILISESNALAEARARVQEKERLTLELDLPKQTLKMAKDIEELRRQLVLLEVVSTNR